MSGAQLDRILWLHSMSGGTYWAQNDAECYPTPLATDLGKGGSFLWAVEGSRYPDGSRPRPLWGADVSGLLYTLNYREHDSPDVLDAWFFDQLAGHVGSLPVGSYTREDDISFGRRILSRVAAFYNPGPAVTRWLDGGGSLDAARTELATAAATTKPNQTLSRFVVLQACRALAADLGPMGVGHACDILARRVGMSAPPDHRLPFGVQDRQRIWRTAHWYRCRQRITVSYLIPRGVEP